MKQLSYLWPLIGREDPPWLRLFLFAVSILLTDLQGKKKHRQEVSVIKL